MKKKKKNNKGRTRDPKTLQVYKVLYEKELEQRIYGKALSLKSKLQLIPKIAEDLQIDFKDLPDGLTKPSHKRTSSNLNQNSQKTFLNP